MNWFETLRTNLSNGAQGATAEIYGFPNFLIGRCRVAEAQGIAFNPIPGVAAAGQGLATFTYEPFDPASVALKDRWVLPNQPPLERLPINSFATACSSNSSFYASLEYGVKWELFRRRLQGTIAVFDIQRRNISTAVEGTLGSAGVGFRELAGKTRARGVDLNLAWSPWRDFQIVGGMLFNQTLPAT